MKIFRVLFYKPAWDKHFLDNAITDYSLLVNFKWKYKDILWALKCGHVEIWTPESDGMYFDEAGQVIGLCWTSTMRGKINGACVRPAKDVLDHPERWFYMEFKVSENGYTAMIEWMKSEVACNKRYDIKDIFKFFLPVRTQDPTDCQKICSGFSSIAILTAENNTTEIVKVLTDWADDVKLNTLYSPLKLAFTLWLCGGIPINLVSGDKLK